MGDGRTVRGVDDIYESKSYKYLILYSFANLNFNQELIHRTTKYMRAEVSWKMDQILTHLSFFLRPTHSVRPNGENKIRSPVILV